MPPEKLSSPKATANHLSFMSIGSSTGMFLALSRKTRRTKLSRPCALSTCTLHTSGRLDYPQLKVAFVLDGRTQGVATNSDHTNDFFSSASTHQMASIFLEKSKFLDFFLHPWIRITCLRQKKKTHCTTQVSSHHVDLMDKKNKVKGKSTALHIIYHKPQQHWPRVFRCTS